MTNLATLLHSLDLTRADALPDTALLEESYTSPGAASFWSALLEDAGLDDRKLKSRPGRSIELYNDAIARHAASGAIALSVLDARGAFQHLSFAELDASATACAAEWSRAGLEPGDVLAIAVPFGPSWVVAFAAALRLGLTVSCLNSFGEDALSRRLRALAPKRIVFDSPAPDPAGEFAERSLAVVRSSAFHAPPVRAYASQQAFAKVFSPLRHPLLQPNNVPAETALLWGLRDARLAYRLAMGEGMCVAGLSLEQHQPALILATLLAGARFIELPVSAIARTPELLAQPFITSLGVSLELRDALRRRPARALPALRSWWRSVDEPLDWMAWQEFSAKNQLERIPSSNLLVDAASGGALLMSARRSGSANAFVLPSAGVSFALSDLGNGGQSAGSSGVFEWEAKPDTKTPGWFLLVRRGTEYLYGSTVAPRRAGRVFGAEEVVACTSRVPSVEGACVAPIATLEPGGVWAFTLLVFAGTLPERRVAELSRELDHAIRTRLGRDFVPDRIVVFPLLPRRKDQKLDVDWCQRQYSTGFLHRKAAHPLFQRLTALRASLNGGPHDVR